ncbi:hypothetical protein EDD21DRAFT_354952 [Dissophora ornata]|nr:hypothetical protein EDD21DRAFT_354952 [Dissophora ornata]
MHRQLFFFLKYFFFSLFLSRPPHSNYSLVIHSNLFRVHVGQEDGKAYAVDYNPLCLITAISARSDEATCRIHHIHNCFHIALLPFPPIAGTKKTGDKKPDDRKSIMLSSAFSPWRSALSPQEALEISSGYLENARNATSPKMALINCDDAKTALSRIRRSVGKDILSSSRAEDRTLCIEISVTYFGLAELLDSLGLHDKTQPLYAKAEKWR